MNMRTFAAVVLLALIAAAPALAHHSLAGVYDLNKTERATGVVQKFAFTNPHGALHIAIKDKNGEVKVWQLTTGSANVLTNAGVTATGPNRVAQRRDHRFPPFDRSGRQERSRVRTQLTARRPTCLSAVASAEAER
jgi:hypothetical protein